jgi:hypothetical protein
VPARRRQYLAARRGRVVVMRRAAPECHTACGKSSRRARCPAPAALVRKRPAASSPHRPGSGSMSNLHVVAIGVGRAPGATRPRSQPVTPTAPVGAYASRSPVVTAARRILTAPSGIDCGQSTTVPDPSTISASPPRRRSGASSPRATPARATTAAATRRSTAALLSPWPRPGARPLWSGRVSLSVPSVDSLRCPRTPRSCAGAAKVRRRVPGVGGNPRARRRT